MNICNLNIPSLVINGTASGYVIGTVNGYTNSTRLENKINNIKYL